MKDGSSISYCDVNLNWRNEQNLIFSMVISFTSSSAVKPENYSLKNQMFCYQHWVPLQKEKWSFSFLWKSFSMIHIRVNKGVYKMEGRFFILVWVTIGDCTEYLKIFKFFVRFYRSMFSHNCCKLHGRLQVNFRVKIALQYMIFYLVILWNYLRGCFSIYCSTASFTFFFCFKCYYRTAGDRITGPVLLTLLLWIRTAIGSNW